ncbi:ComEC family competence protein [Marinilongibacter aquaticus]|uniref:ComEC/Rec2 family competence protein n=1 Tax=Marinilongibacter aquaticus TaxID=2975157 RepID=UPI0021BD8423|nr:ComEC/Rec2 family competence protein [Marinilongibacter aquaticus]UBM57731.1 ComEC family competence protein [Marinilongibacter aquaticus]
MKAYPFIRPLLFYILGLLFHAHFDGYAKLFFYGLIFSCGVLLIGLYFKSAWVRSISLYLSIFCFAYTLAEFKAEERYNLGNIDAYVARVESAVEPKPKSFKVRARIVSIRTKDEWKDTEFSALLYLQKNGIEKPKYGDLFLVSSTLREIEGPKNPMEFDYRSFQARRGIHYHDFLRTSDFSLLGNSPQSAVLAKALQWNDKAAGILSAAISDKKALAVAEAMLLGRKDDVDFTLSDQYATAGAVHILAVSGLHVGILMLMLNAIFGFLKRFKQGLWLYGLVTLTLLWIYALFTGMSPSVTRATLMFSLFQLGTLIRRDRNSINVLAASAFVLLLFKPNWIFEVGFQLSYLAIFGILFLYPYLNRLVEPRNKWVRNLWQITIVSVSAQLFTFPLSVYYFHQFPSYFLLTNPLVTVFSMGVLFCGLPYLFLSQIPFVNFPFLIGLKTSLKVLNFGVAGISQWPLAKLSGFSLHVWEVLVLYFLLMFLVFFFLRREPKLLFVSLAVAFGVLAFNLRKDFRAKEQKELAIHYIPKGYGMSFISGKSATFIGDSASLVSDRVYGFHLKNYYDHRGVNHVHFQAVDNQADMFEWSWGYEHWLWVKNYGRYSVKERFDKVLISNNAVYRLAEYFESPPGLILLDDSNSAMRALKLKAEADSLGWNVLSLYEKGGQVY